MRTLLQDTSEADSPVLSAFMQMRRRLLLLARSMLHNEPAADDALQEVFVRLWQRKERINSIEDATRLFTTGVRNECIDTLRKEQNHGTTNIDDEPSLCNTPVSEETEEQEVRQVLWNEVQAIIQSRLSAVQQRILHLRDYEGLEFEEIGRQLDLPPNIVRTYLSRARKTVREVYRERQGCHKG